MFMETGDASQEPLPRRSNPNPAAGQAGPEDGGDRADEGEQPVRPADPRKRQRLMDASPPREMGPWRYGPVPGGFGPVASRNAFQDGAEAIDYVPMALGGNAAAAAGGGESGHKRKLSQLFSPPTSILFNGTFQAARANAKLSQKWLLVNIQNSETFESCKLNRDTWKDEMVQAVIQASCVFWQAEGTPEAKTFQDRYNATALPHIGLIDPRTGKQVWSVEGFISGEVITEKILDLSSKHNLGNMEDDVKAGSKGEPVKELSEEEQLAAAIAESMAEGGGGENRNGVDSAEKKKNGEKFANDSGSDNSVEVFEPGPTSPVMLAKLPLPVEPEKGAEGAAEVRIFMPDGSTRSRRFLSEEKVIGLYRYCLEALDGAKSREFDLRNNFPNESLAGSIDKTLAEVGINRARLRMTWVEDE
ncbi:unnamed protein product [Chrysoparadoxa australica]